MSIYSKTQVFARIFSEIEELKNENKEIREKLDKLESQEIIIVENEDLSDIKIEMIILNYLRSNQGKEIFPSDIAFKYDLDARKVFEICNKLKKEGKLI